MAPPMPARVLVVDDSEALRKSVCYAIQRISDVVCVEASDGAEALQKTSDGTFDLVITDINMPNLDGFKLLAALRGDPRFSHTPVVVVTTERGDDDRARAQALGAVAYLTKPVQAADVVAVVRQVLGLL